MQKKIYVGGLPWEFDRISLLNYFKANLEANNIEASYELPFVTTPLSNPNATVKVTDVFVAKDSQTGKSRGFGFITLELTESEDVETLYQNIIDMIAGKIVIGIRGPRELIVNNAEPREQDREGGARPAMQEQAAPVIEEAEAPVEETESTGDVF